MNPKPRISRRIALRNLGALGGAFLTLGADQQPTQAGSGALRPAKPLKSGNARKQIFEKVFSTPMVDTHEHLPDESQCLQRNGPGSPRCNDWALLFSHYLDSDLLTAGMPKADLDRFSRRGPIRPKMAAAGAVLAGRQEHRLRPGRPHLHPRAVWRRGTVRAPRPEGPGRIREDAPARLLPADPLRAREHRVLPGQLPDRRAVQGIGHAHAADAGHQHRGHVRRARTFKQYAPPTGIEVKGLVRLAPRDPVVVRALRAVRRGREIPARLQPRHRLCPRSRGEGASPSSGRCSPKNPSSGDDRKAPGRPSVLARGGPGDRSTNCR